MYNQYTYFNFYDINFYGIKSPLWAITLTLTCLPHILFLFKILMLHHRVK